MWPLLRYCRPTAAWSGPRPPPRTLHPRPHTLGDTTPAPPHTRPSPTPMGAYLQTGWPNQAPPAAAEHQPGPATRSRGGARGPGRPDSPPGELTVATSATQQKLPPRDNIFCVYREDPPGRQSLAAPPQRPACDALTTAACDGSPPRPPLSAHRPEFCQILIWIVATRRRALPPSDRPGPAGGRRGATEGGTAGQDGAWRNGSGVILCRGAESWERRPPGSASHAPGGPPSRGADHPGK